MVNYLQVAVNCWSETNELKSVIVCKPSPLNISEKEDLKQIGFKYPVTTEELLECYLRIKNIFQTYSIKTYDLSEFISKEKNSEYNGCVNRIFVRDVAGVIGNTVVLGKPALSSRNKEFEIAHSALQCMRTPSKENIDCLIEFGDLLILNRNVIIVNFGLRTERKAISQLASIAWKQGFQSLIVTCIPRRYKAIHLDLVFNVLKGNACVGDKRMAKLSSTILHPNGKIYHDSFINILNSLGIKVYWADRSTAFMYNFIALNNEEVLINSAYIGYFSSIFKECKITPITTNLTDLEKGGGSIRCATLPIYRA